MTIFNKMIPAIAIVANSETPYRLHLHRRIAREMPEVRLWSIFTHETSDSPWVLTSPPEIGPVMLGKGEGSERQTQWSNALNEWKRGGRVIRFLIEHDVRAIVMMGYNDPGRMRVMRWCHRNGVLCLLFGDSNIRGDRAAGLKGTLKRLYLRKVLSWCDAVLACGTLGQQYFQKYGAAAERIFFFPYEPDYQEIASRDESQQIAVETRYGIKKGRRRLIYSGRLAPVKRVDLLIEAFNRIAEDRPDWDLLIIGDGPLRETLQASVKQSLLTRVTWTGFIGEQSTVGALYHCGDVLVLPSDAEPWALVINEATAAGLAVVSSNVVGASEELVQDGVNGRLFDAGDSEQLTTALLDVTDAKNIDRYKSASPAVLTHWRERGDPVNGLRAALRVAGLK